MSAAAAAVTPTVRRGKGAQVRIQRFGAFLTGMIMPNLPAFLAWGLITSFFIAAGWTPLYTGALRAMKALRLP